MYNKIREERVKMKNLIVYYSYEGNTEELVKGMQNEIEADVLKLVPKKEKK